MLVSKRGQMFSESRISEYVTRKIFVETIQVVSFVGSWRFLCVENDGGGNCQKGEGGEVIVDRQS